MFGILKKKLKQSVEGLVRRAEREEKEEPAAAPRPKKVSEPKKRPERAAEEKKEEPVPVPLTVEDFEEKREEKVEKREKRGLFRRIKEKEFSEKEIDDFFAGLETELLQANLALEVIDSMKTGLKERLAGKPVPRREAGSIIREAFGKILLGIVDIEAPDIEGLIKGSRKDKRPLCVLFLGFNGSGKTTTIAKLSKMLMDKGYKPVFAAADTFRAASIEQLEVHAGRLGVGIIKHKYGADPAAVIFDARKHAESKGLDIVMADSAGRMHTNVNLMDELKKIVRVNSPDLKILVVDSLTGNDVISQVRTFNEEVGIDALVLTKMDVNEKGGSIISACHASGKPVLFIGTGQAYADLQRFEPEKFVKGLLQ